jgi:hypothetical protein
MMRGEPGEFAVGARRQGAVWRVAGVTAAAKTLTVRVEDLWLRTPVEWRARRYTVEILRDPSPARPGPVSTRRLRHRRRMCVWRWIWRATAGSC